MARKTLLWPAILAALFGFGIAGSKPEILVFGAASLTEALEELGRAWEAKTGQTVTFSFGASSDLARQIEAGAPADLFFSADTAKMDALEVAGRVRHADSREFLSNVLVVVVPRESKVEIRSPQDVARLPRIALADPAAVPAGIYAKKWLTSVGLWSEVESRVIPTLDVRAALGAVESGSVPAAVVYRTDASISKSARIAYEVTAGPEILYSVAPIEKARNRGAADAFADFLAGEEGRAEFRRRGFRIRDMR